MRILVLDDMEFRHDFFDDKYKGHEVTHTYNFTQFLDGLEKSPYDLIHLDHDLGEYVKADYWIDRFTKPHEFNGQNAALAVINLPSHMLPKRVIIHSINPRGAELMYYIINSRSIPVGIEPFEM